MLFVIWSCLFLFICAMVDLKTKKVYLNICMVNYGLAVGIKLLFHELDLKSVILGIILCGILFVISLVTKGAIGQGDILIMLALTGILKVEYALQILMISLFICSLFSILMLSIKKMRIKSVIPFVPFLFFGELVWLILGGKYV